MNERIRAVRADAGISQEKFANSLNLSRQYVALLETGERVPSDRTVSDICRVYSVREEWLRGGSGERYVQTEPDSVKQLVEEKKLPPRMVDLLHRVMSLDPAVQESIVELVENIAKAYGSGSDPPEK